MRRNGKLILCWLLLGAGVALGQGAVPAADAPAGPASEPGVFLDEKYDNGQLKSHYSILPGGVKQGIYVLFYADGKRQERGSYLSGQLDGIRQVFFPGGQIKLQENYEHGQLDGVVRELDEKGIVVRSAEYRLGNLSHETLFKGNVPVSDKTLVDGMLVYPRSKVMILAELRRIASLKVETTPATEHGPAFEDEETPATCQDAVHLLMQYRYLCGVPYEQMKLDADYCAHAAAAAHLCSAIGHLDHKPANPSWPEDNYQFALEGTSHGNLYETSRRGPLGKVSIEGYMDDSEASNIDRLPHRRWCLNPYMGKTGFGTFKGYSAMWSWDHSNENIPPYDFIAYPSPGFFPVTYFSFKQAWSVELNERKYALPVEKDLKVTLTPVQVQTAVNKLERTGPPIKLEYLHVNLEGYSDIRNCIIFRPASLHVLSGAAYLIEIGGLKTSDDQPAALKYVVEFF